MYIEGYGHVSWYISGNFVLGVRPIVPDGKADLLKNRKEKQEAFGIAVHSAAGRKRKGNQDSVLVKTARTSRGPVALAAICDGMGGLSRGELASKVLVSMLSRWFEEELPGLLLGDFGWGSMWERLVPLPGTRKRFQDGLWESWRQLLNRANERLCSCGGDGSEKLGSTAAVLLLIGDWYYIVNVGDSRIYQVENRLLQLTRDQTLVQQEIEAGRLTKERARLDPRRSILLQCIGACGGICPDFHVGKVKQKSLFLLCSDGFRHVVTEQEMYPWLCPERISGEKAMKQALEELTRLNQERQEPDDISAVLIGKI